MMNIKKLAAKTAIALVLGVSAIAVPMNAGMANADGPSTGFVQTVRATALAISRSCKVTARNFIAADGYFVAN